MAKVIGALLLLIPQVPARIKEWIYVCFSVVLISAAIAKFNSGYPMMEVVEPMIVFTIMVGSLLTLNKLNKAWDINSAPHLIMNLFVLGATGAIGKHLLDIDLERGHRVTSYVRSPRKIHRAHERLKVIQGDVFGAQSDGAFAGRARCHPLCVRTSDEGLRMESKN
jgi:NAD(P)H-binding